MLRRTENKLKSLSSEEKERAAGETTSVDTEKRGLEQEDVKLSSEMSLPNRGLPTMTAPARPKKHFTPEQVNQTLPLVRAIVNDIVQLYQDVHERRDRLARIRQKHGLASSKEETAYSEELEQVEHDLEKDIVRLQDFADELDELGAELKDPVTGLIDFLAEMDGREVYLCWKLGEEEVLHWHELDAGFGGRQSLLESSLSAQDRVDDEQSE